MFNVCTVGECAGGEEPRFNLFVFNVRSVMHHQFAFHAFHAIIGIAFVAAAAAATIQLASGRMNGRARVVVAK